MSAEPRLVARVEDEGGRLRIVAPAIGQWRGAPASGTVLGPGSPIGELVRLGRRHPLSLPDVAPGIVEDAPEAARLRVEYGATLFRLAPLVVAESSNASARSVGPTAGGGEHRIGAPIDGVFHRRPAPEAAPFVEVGARIAAGRCVGLIEVMKTFNQIVFDPPGGVEHGEIVEIRCADGQEVHAGQVLVVVRPAR
jgi:biotin carboxyl carrier protein